MRIGDDLHSPGARRIPTSRLLGPRKTFSRIEIDGAKLAQAAVARRCSRASRRRPPSDRRAGLELTGPSRCRRGSSSRPRTTVTARCGPRSCAARTRCSPEFSRGGQGSTRTSAPRASRCRSPPKSRSRSFRERHSNAAGHDDFRVGRLAAEWHRVRHREPALGRQLDGGRRGHRAERLRRVFAPRSSPTARPRAAASSRCAAPRQARLERPPRRQLYRDARRAGSIDLTRAIQTGGKFATGRTEFSEMNGQATYDRGAVALRNITLAPAAQCRGERGHRTERRAFGPHRRRRAGCLPDDARDALPRRHREGASRSGTVRAHATLGQRPAPRAGYPVRALSESRLRGCSHPEEDRFRRERRGGAVPLLRHAGACRVRAAARRRLLDDARRRLVRGGSSI